MSNVRLYDIGDTTFGYGPGTGGGTGAGDFVHASFPTPSLENVQAALGIPVPLAYGWARVRGNIALLYDDGSGARVAIVLLGEGEWDGIDRLWINKKLHVPGDGNTVRFHPGIDGTLGHGLTPDSTGGDQDVDGFFALLPANVPPLTFSRKAWLMMYVLPDPGAPSADLDWLGDFRTMRCRIFDNTGTQSDYRFTTNPIDELIDLRIRAFIKREALINAALLTAEKARFDWPCYWDSRAQCDEVLTSGEKRFEASVGWPQRVSLAQLEQQLLDCCRGYWREVGGKLQIRVDQARATTFSLSRSHVIGGATFDKKDVRAAPNRFIGTFRNLQPKVVATIASIARAGGVVTVETDEVHPFVVTDRGADTVDIWDVATAGFDGSFLLTTVPDDHHFTYAQAGADASDDDGGNVGTPESRFMDDSPVIVDHEPHQFAVGQRGLGLSAMPMVIPTTIDFGANTPERVSRLLKYMAIRSLGPMTTPYKAPFQGSVVAAMYSVDDADRVLLAQLPGDTLAVEPSVSEEFQGDFEIIELELKLSGSDGPGTITLALRQYIPEAFTDVADDHQAIATLPQVHPLGATTVVDGEGYLSVPSTKLPVNSVFNYDNDVIVDSIDGGDGTATVRAHGSAGTSASWTWKLGIAGGLETRTYPATSFTGKVLGGTHYFVAHDPATGDYVCTTDYDQVLPSNYQFVGDCLTVNAGGGGGSSGGGGTGDGGGGRLLQY